MCTEIVNSISGKEFYEIILGEDDTITSEERLEEQFGNLYKHLTNNIWCAKTKYKHTRSANDGLFKITLKDGEEVYILQECKLYTKDWNKALCQIAVYYNMESSEIQKKIKYFVIVTPTTYDIIPIECVRHALNKIAVLMESISITPSKAYENPIIFSSLIFESNMTATHFDWRKLDDMSDIIKALIKN
jgi:hypothetical protein